VSNTRPLLEGHADSELDSLREALSRAERENSRLERELSDKRAELSTLLRKYNTSVLPMKHLKRVLDPLYRALQEIYEDIGDIPSDDTTITVSSRTAAVWNKWKQDLGGKAGDLIDALLQHREMNAVQLRVAMHCHINTVYETTARMQKLGLLNKNGGKYSLKEL